MSDYRYPVSEDVTEPSEAAQDPEKRAREHALIAAHANFSWTRALDFGCGRGGNLAVLAGAGTQKNKSIIGTDIDARRVEQARAAAAGLDADIEIRRADIAAIEASPDRFDLILVCQIIGHTPTAETERILATLRARLAPAGRMILCYPFITPSAANALHAPGDEDFFHLVDFAAQPNTPAFRRPIARDAFNAAAKRPAAGLLPVRAFMTADMAWRAGESLPAEASTPPAIASHLPGLALQSVMYSVHYTTTGAGCAGIGDMATIATV